MSEVRVRGGAAVLVLSMVAALLTAAALVEVGIRAPTAEAAGNGPYVTAVLAAAPAGYWRLGESTGATAADSSPNVRVGTYSGGLTRGAPGALPADSNGATGFNGSTGQVTIGDAAALRLNGSFTIELWTKLTSFVNTWPGLMLKGDSSTANGYLLYYTSNGTVRLKRNNVEISTNAGAITTAKYSHLIAAYDGSILRWYVNGRLATSSTVTFPVNAGTAALTLGRADQFGAQSLDEVALYNTALSSTQVANHYLTGIAAVASSGDPVLMAAGDIACPATDPNFAGTNPTVCQAFSTAELIARNSPTVLAPLGDLVYGDRSVSDFQTSYGVSWGALSSAVAVRPIPGNHDYGGSHSSITSSSTAPGYFGYLGAAVANPGGVLAPNGQPAGWYSYDIGSWHIVALNHECAAVGGCAAGGPQDQWLANDLATHPAACTAVMGHEPRWSDAGDEPEYQDLWQREVANHVTLLLSGHDHNYQRFAPRDGDGGASSSGVRQFVVGGGGNSSETFPGGSTAQFRDATHFGALKLTLHATSYDWQYLALDGSVLDAGSSACVGTTSNTYSSSVLAASPAAYWRLGETSGTVAADASPNSRNGTYSTGVTLGVPGALLGDPNTAARFNGTTAVVAVADDAALRLNGSFTIELWAKMTSFVNTWPGLVLKGDSNTASGYLIYYNSAGVVRLKRNGVEVSSTAGALGTTAYSHLVVTYDGATVRWYVNGTLSSSAAATYPTNVGTAALSLGRADQFGAQSLDDVAFYNSPLSAATIASHYTIGHG